jgi:hypothetical protein
MYRDTLLQLVSRLIGVKMGDFEATFSSEARQVEEIVAEARKELPSSPVAGKSDLIDLAKASPNNAINEAWSRIERRLVELATSLGQEASQMPTLRLISFLAERQAINGHVAVSLRGLTAMRNLAVHATSFEVTAERAVEFVTIANTVEILLSTPGLRTARPKMSAA